MFFKKKRKRVSDSPTAVATKRKEGNEYKVELQEYITIKRVMSDGYGFEAPRTLLKLSIPEAEKLNGDLVKTILAHKRGKNPKI